jgi:hypothetical protein
MFGAHFEAQWLERLLGSFLMPEHPLGQNTNESSKRLVPTARLELAQLSPLPPQDSVSTNFTTSAATSFALGLHEE